MKREDNMKKIAPLVVMMCGVADSGKSTYAQQLELNGYVRLSIDEEIWESHGRYGIDYPADKYEEYKMAAERKLPNRLIELIHSRQQVVIDFSFWQRAKRNEYKQLIEEAGGQWELFT